MFFQSTFLTHTRTPKTNINYEINCILRHPEQESTLIVFSPFIFQSTYNTIRKYQNISKYIFKLQFSEKFIILYNTGVLYDIVLLLYEPFRVICLDFFFFAIVKYKSGAQLLTLFIYFLQFNYL